MIVCMQCAALTARPCLSGVAKASQCLSIRVPSVQSPVRSKQIEAQLWRKREVDGGCHVFKKGPAPWSVYRQKRSIAKVRSTEGMPPSEGRRMTDGCG